MRHVIFAAAAAFAFAAGAACAQNATSGLQVMPGMNGESSGTVTGTGPGRDGAFGSPAGDPRETGAARGSTSGKGAAGERRGSANRSTIPDEGHRALGGRKRSSAASGADPR